MVFLNFFLIPNLFDNITNQSRVFGPNRSRTTSYWKEKINVVHATISYAEENK